MKLFQDVTYLPAGRQPDERSLFYRCAHPDYSPEDVTWSMHIPLPFKRLTPDDYGRTFWYGKAVYCVMVNLRNAKLHWWHAYLTIPKPELIFGLPKKTPINRWVS